MASFVVPVPSGEATGDHLWGREGLRGMSCRADEFATCRMAIRAALGDLTPVYPSRSSERQGGPSVDPDLRVARSAALCVPRDALEG